MNNAMIISISLSVFSFAGMAVVILRHLKSERVMAEENPTEDADKSLLKPALNSMADLSVRLWRNFLVPIFYKLLDKIVSWMQIFTKKAEIYLIKFSNYIKGKRKINPASGGTEYWGEVIDFKNGLNGDGDSKPE